MKREQIPFGEFTMPLVYPWSDCRFLLTAGENKPGGFNMMAVGWGGFGFIWSKPLALVMVRPSRYTFQFIERHDSFTLCAFASEFKDKIMFCGTKSGRDVDKVQVCGFTLIPSTRVKAPALDEAELIIECRKMYADAIKPERFLVPDIENHYGGKDYHHFYLGEMLAVFGTRAYRKQGGR